MAVQSIVDGMNNVDTLLSVVALVILRKHRLIREYSFLASLLAVKVLSFVVLFPLLYMSSHHIINGHRAYPYYFYSFWISFAVEAVLWLMVIYNMYKLAMAPLKGLQSLGMLVFRWAAAISAVVTIAMAFAPHSTIRAITMAAITQLQQTTSVLTLCLLLFVTFAIRPMGLSYRSRIFGISLGMGILATANLISSSWLVGRREMYDTYNIFNAVVVLAVTVLWTTYFALPEPERHIIVLPTTSPFLRWNQISMALGGNPGFVAVGSVAPGAFAGAELEVMRRSSVASMSLANVKPDMSIAV
jgi:hypothetical protein